MNSLCRQALWFAVCVAFAVCAAYTDLCVPQAHAHEPVEPVLDSIVVEGQRHNGVGNSDAASEGTATRKMIEERPALRPGEVLEFVPGVIVSQHSGDGKANQYYLRGFNLDHGTDFATWVAGMPVNMRSHAHGQGYTDLNFLIPELISRIDYRKGPYFADDGDFSSAGSARIGYLYRLERPLASLSLGENGYQRLVGAGSTATGAGTLLGAIELNRNDGPWEVPSNFRKLNAVGRWSIASGDDNVGLTAMGYSGKWTSTDQIPKRAVDAGQVSRFGSLDPTDGGESMRASLSLDWSRTFSDGAFQLNAYAVRSRLDLFSNFTYFLAQPSDLGDPINGDQFRQSEKRGMAGLNASRSWTGKLGDAAMTNKVGLQLRYDRINPLGLHATVGRETANAVRQDQVKEGSAGLYGENSVQWTAWLRSVFGLRFDRYTFDVASDNPANSGNLDAHITSPKLAFILGPWARTEFFVNYGEGFHSNDARGTTTRVSPATGLPVDTVTPLVKTRGGELGARTEIIPGLQSSLALWQLRLGSELVFIGDAGDTEASRASRRSGVEWTNYWRLRQWLLLDLNLAASKARFTGDDPAGNYVPGSIDKVASMGLTVTDWQGWFGALQWRYFGPRPLTEDNSQRSAATSLAYLRFGRQIDKNVRLSLDIYNLFNRQVSDIDYYYASRLRGEPPGGVNDNHFHPVEPRTLRATLQMSF
jgi:outer membrane receptor protein involved in Fe transport